jgi:hypothetical protein
MERRAATSGSELANFRVAGTERQWLREVYGASDLLICRVDAETPIGLA